MLNIFPVVLCGGVGTRLWPLSRKSYPKQFLELAGEHSLFQQAALRLDTKHQPVIITASDYRFLARQQLAEIGIEKAEVLIEPTAKNTAPAILAAANQSLSLLTDYPNHTFFAVTVRPQQSFLKNFNWNDRTSAVEILLQTLIIKYQSHLTPLNTNKPKNHHLKIISHNAIETKTKSGSDDIAHSHGIWGIPNELLMKWGLENGVFHSWKTDDLTTTIRNKGHIILKKRKVPLSQVVHSVKVELLLTNPIQNLYDPDHTPEGWLDYSYKWFGDGRSEWSFISTPTKTITREKPNDASSIPYIPKNQSIKPISRVSGLV